MHFTEDTFESFTGIAREVGSDAIIEKLKGRNSDFYVATHTGPLKRS